MINRSMTKAEDAVNYLLGRITRDGRLAYLLGYGTEAFRRLTDAQADLLGVDPDTYREQVWSQCRPERIAAGKGR